MFQCSPADEAYWMGREETVLAELVDLAGYGFVIDHHCRRAGWTEDPRCLLRRGVAEALVQARAALPEGHNFKVVDGWRPWAIQEACAKDAEGRIRAAHRDWSEEQVRQQLWTMVPPARIVPKLNSHRYGGAVDLTVVGPEGAEVDMGVPLNYVEGPEAALLFYEFREDLSGREIGCRGQRRVLLRAMASAGFEPYLPEYWHWGSYR